MARKSRPYSAPKRNTRKKENLSNTTRIKKNKLDVTTRIRVDEIRLNDYESLDTSFLEGRANKKVNKDTRRVKEKILKDDSSRIKKLNFLKRIFYSIAIIGTFILLIIFIVGLVKKIDLKKPKKNNNNVVLKSPSDDKVIDNNYLFVGDFYTDKFDFKKYDLDYHYVKSSKEKLKTDDVLDDMKSYIYKYNPSIVFIELGIIDLDDDKSVDDIVNNISEIIDLIKKNRPYADIYVESIYPINKDVDDFDEDILDDDIDNSDIVSLNKKLKKISEDKKVGYLDTFGMLEKNGKLDKDFTDNGVYLNDDGYKQVLKLIKKKTENM